MARRALSEALREAGVAHDPEGSGEALIEAAEAAIAGEAKLAALRQKAEERRADAARAEGKFRNASEADASWRAAWREACAGTWLGEAEGEPALSAVRQSLKALDELRATLKERADLADRIAKMERDKRLFADEVAAAAAALDLDDVGDEVRQRADAVEERVARARENARRRAEKAKALDNARGRLAAIAEALDVNARQARAMTELFAVDTLAEVAVKLEDCRRRDEARAEIAKEIRAIVGAGVAASLEAARAVLEGADAAALAAELASLKTRAPHDDQAHAEAHSAHREAIKRLEAVGGDDAVARIEEKRRTILEEIKDGARRYLALRAGVAAADEALRLYRDRHRGAMMERASRAFSLISRGAYRGLTTAPNGQSETLIALGADGGSKEAEQLSKGARFQLYLALRVAGYHELAKTRRPGALRRRRHHGDVRPFPRRGGAAPVRRDGARRPGHLLHPPSAPGRDRQSRVPGGEGARAAVKRPLSPAPARVARRETWRPTAPVEREKARPQLCTPLTYQSITRASPSLIFSPLATRSLPD